MKQVADVRKACGDKFIILSGDDALTLPMMDLGGVGVISVVANIAPADVVKMIAAYNSGDKNTANKLNTKLLPLIKAMFVETNPSPVKAAAELMGLCSGKTRLPLCELEPENLEKVRTALKDYGLIG